MKINYNYTSKKHNIIKITINLDKYKLFSFINYFFNEISNHRI